jgi:hypothetical protein
MAEHTPTPWHVGPYYKEDIESGSGRVGQMFPLNSPRGAANAAHAVHCVNAHDALVAALRAIAEANPRAWEEDMRDQFQPWAQNIARAAIAKAEGK